MSRALPKSNDIQTSSPRTNRNQILQDVIPSSSPRLLHDLHGRPPWLPLYSRPAGIAIPLPRGPSKQHSLQPFDQVLRCQILELHVCWIRGSIRRCLLANTQEPGLIGSGFVVN